MPVRRMLDAAYHRSGLGTLYQFRRVLHVDARIADGTLDPGVTGQDLYRPHIAGRLVGDRGSGAAKRARATVLRLQPDTRPHSRMSRAYWRVPIRPEQSLRVGGVTCWISRLDDGF